MLILGQNDIFCGYNVINFSVWLVQLPVFKYLVANNVTENWLGHEFDSCHIAVKLDIESIFQAV